MPVTETILWSPDQRLPVDRELIRSAGEMWGDKFTEDHWNAYYADYYGLAYKYRPETILEIGVRFGYTGVYLYKGARDGGSSPTLEYYGLDNESYVPLSLIKAYSLFEQTLFPATINLLQWDSQKGLPDFLPQKMMFDLIHIDGDHTAEGALTDLNNSWARLNEGGLMIVDDSFDPRVKAACEEFLRLQALTEGEARFQFWECNSQGHFYIQRGDNP